MYDRPALFLSVRPRFAQLILSGKKSVELRRVRPNVQAGDLILLYASSPIRELLGVCTVAGVEVAPAHALWKKHGGQTGVRRAEFDSYFAGCVRAVAISLADVQRVTKPRTLEELRDRLPGFVPPQSFSYISYESARRLQVTTEDGQQVPPEARVRSARR
jgi:predicted transcriptional regulator